MLFRGNISTSHRKEVKNTNFKQSTYGRTCFLQHYAFPLKLLFGIVIKFHEIITILMCLNLYLYLNLVLIFVPSRGIHKLRNKILSYP